MPFLRKYIVPAAKYARADLMEIAAAENVEAAFGRKISEAASKSVGKQTLRKQLGSGGKSMIASRVFATKSTKHNSWSRKDKFTNICHYSCQKVAGTNLLWQFRETFERKSQ